MDKKIKTIFIGTPEFAVPALRSLLKNDLFDIVLAITQPDKKVGRKQILTASPVKNIALENNLLLLQPEKIKDITDEIADIKPDLIVVAAYAQIIPESILNIPKYGCINIHGSLLPKYRGAACIPAAIINGDRETGITIMKMDKGLDTGPILDRSSIPINNDDTGATLYAKLSDLGAELLIPTLLNYIDGKVKPQIQDDPISSYVGMLKKEDGKIDWSQDAQSIERFVRAMIPWPEAWTTWLDKKLTIKSSICIDADTDHKIGEVALFDDRLAVGCGNGFLIIDKLQIEGKNAMNAKDFLSGNKKIIGSILK